MKQNSKAFMMGELLAVTVVILIMFGFVYVNFLPTTSEYKKKTAYQDLNATYDIYYFKKIYREEYKTPDDIKLNDDNYITLYSNNKCQQLSNEELNSICDSFAQNAKIYEVILTKYDLSDIKYSNNNLKAYINYLKDSEKPSSSQYRLILKTKNNTYATVELFKDILTYDLKIINNSGGTLKYYNTTASKEEKILEDTTRTMTNILKGDKITVETELLPGYNISKMTLNGTELKENSFIYNYSGNSVLVIEYIPNEHNITINNSEGGVLKVTNLTSDETTEVASNQSATIKFLYNDEIKLETIPNTKYRLGKIDIKKEIITNHTIKLSYDEDITLNTTWTQDPYKITKTETLATFTLPDSAYYNDEITISDIKINDDNLTYKGALVKDLENNILLTLNNETTFKMPNSDIKVELLFTCKDKNNCNYTSRENILD